MSDFSYDHQVTVRSIGQVKAVFDRLVIDLKASAKLRFRGRKISREAFGNAVWLYINDMKTEELEKALAPYIARLEMMLEDDPGARGGTAPPEDYPDVSVEDLTGEDEAKPPKARRKGAG